MILLHRRGRLLLDLEAETRRELDRAHHAHRILLEANLGIANRTDDLLLDVRHAANPVNDAEVADVVEETVHREIAAIGVRLRRAEGVVLERTLRRMLDNLAHRLGVLAESRRFNHLLAKTDVRETEPTANQEAIAEGLLDLVGLRARPHIEILRLATHQQVTHAAAHEVARIAQLVQAIQDLQSIGIDVLARNTVVLSLVNDRARFLPSQKRKHFGVLYYLSPTWASVPM